MFIPWGAIIAIGGAVATIVTWLVTLERRLLHRPTFDQHDKICMERQQVITDKIEDLKKHLARQDADSDDYRKDMREALNIIGLDIAAVQTKLKIARPRRSGRLLPGGD